MINKKDAMIISWQNLNKVKYMLICMLLIQLVFVSCQKQHKVETAETTDTTDNTIVLPSDNQTFLMTVTLDQKNVEQVRSLFEKDLLPLVGGIKEVKNLKVFNTPVVGSTNTYYVLFEMQHADRIGIKLNSSGQVKTIDFS